MPLPCIFIEEVTLQAGDFTPDAGGAANAAVHKHAKNGESIVSYDFVEKDLAHIRNVLNYLEHSAGYLHACETGAAIDLRWWRARIQAVLAMPLLPIHIERQARDLLSRLDHLPDQSGLRTDDAGEGC